MNLKQLYAEMVFKGLNIESQEMKYIAEKIGCKIEINGKTVKFKK